MNLDLAPFLATMMTSAYKSEDEWMMRHIRQLRSMGEDYNDFQRKFAHIEEWFTSSTRHGDMDPISQFERAMSEMYKLVLLIRTSDHAREDMNVNSEAALKYTSAAIAALEEVQDEFDQTLTELDQLSGSATEIRQILIPPLQGRAQLLQHQLEEDLERCGNEVSELDREVQAKQSGGSQQQGEIRDPQEGRDRELQDDHKILVQLVERQQKAKGRHQCLDRLAMAAATVNAMLPGLVSQAEAVDIGFATVYQRSMKSRETAPKLITRIRNVERITMSADAAALSMVSLVVEMLELCGDALVDPALTKLIQSIRDEIIKALDQSVPDLIVDSARRLDQKIRLFERMADNHTS